MSKMIEIASKIKELNGGEFQKLADLLLLEKGYKNYNPLGSMSTSKKTTRGIPDTYFFEDGKYVFVMHTTENNFFKKLEEDLDDCLLLMSEKKVQVKEIILCHTSDNITTVQQNQLYGKIKSDVKLSIYGLGEISRNLYQSYPWIAKDILGVSIDTEQILSLKEFSIGRGLISLPDLTNDFIGRDKEISDLRNIFSSHDCVVVSGKSGSGKSKLAYEIGHDYEKQGYDVYVLKSRKMNIYDDIKRYLSSSDRLFLIIDDAFDFISQLQIIIEEVFSKKNKMIFKIMMTTRDYQLDRLDTELRKFIKFHIYGLNLLEDEKIEEIVKRAYPITNPKYLEQIVKLSAGNPRLALMASKTAVDTNKIPYDATQIYDEYYKPIINNIDILKNKKVLRILGLISFFAPILIVDLKNMMSNDGIKTTDGEIDNLIDEIEETEVIEIHKNKVVYIADQGFRNYFFKYVFIDLKILSIENILKEHFKSNRGKVVDFFNTIFGIYGSNELFDFLKDKVNRAWTFFENGSIEDKFSYAQVFREFNIEKTILICEELMVYDKEHSERLGILGTTFGKAKDIINLLVSINQMEYRTIALKKVVDFVIDTENYSHFEKVLMHEYNIDPNAEFNGYEAQKYIVSEFSILTNNGMNEEITLILLRLYSELLKTSHTPTSFKKNNYVLYRIDLSFNEASLSYRAEIWKRLKSLAEDIRYKNEVLEIISKISYLGFENKDDRFIDFDIDKLDDFIHSSLTPKSFYDSLFVFKICKKYAYHDKYISKKYTDYLDNEELVFYLKLSGKRNYKVTDFYKEEQMLIDDIKRIAKQFTIQDIKDILEFLINRYDLVKDDFKIKQALYWITNEVADKNDMFYSLVSGLLNSEKLCSFYTLGISSIVIVKMGKTESMNFIMENCLPDKTNIVLMTYYQTIDKDILEYEDAQGVLGLISKYDENLISMIDARNLSLLYSFVDEKFSIKMFNIISKIISNDHVYRSIYDSLFYLPAHQLIGLFSNDLETIFKLYIKVLQQHETIDYTNELFRILLNDNPDRIIQFIEDINKNYYNSKIQDIWSIKRFKESITRLLDYYHSKSEQSFMWEHDLSVLFEKPEYDTKRLLYFKELFHEKADDINYIMFLAKTFKEIPISNRLEYIHIFVGIFSNNIDIFTIMISEPSVQSFSGNRSAYLADKKRGYESILKIIPNENLKYRICLQEKIKSLNKYIEQVEIDELLNPY